MFRGRIILYDPLEGRGLIKLDGSFDTVPFSVLHFQTQPHSGRKLEQREVSFELLHTPEGYRPHNIRLVSEGAVTTLDYVLLGVGPLAVCAATYAAPRFLSWPYVQSYLIAINLFTLVLVLLLSRRAKTPSLHPLEVEVILLSVAGGAVGTIVSARLVQSRFRYPPAIYGMIALLLLHFVLLQQYFPSFFRESSWRRIVSIR